MGFGENEILRKWDFWKVGFWESGIFGKWDFGKVGFWENEILRKWDFDKVQFEILGRYVRKFWILEKWVFGRNTFWECVILEFNYILCIKMSPSASQQLESEQQEEPLRARHWKWTKWALVCPQGKPAGRPRIKIQKGKIPQLGLISKTNSGAVYL